MPECLPINSTRQLARVCVLLCVIGALPRRAGTEARSCYSPRWWRMTQGRTVVRKSAALPGSWHEFIRWETVKLLVSIM